MNIRTNFSILQCIVSPEDMVKACKAAGYDKLILCDNNLSGVVQFYNACKKNEIKPVIGMTLKICELSPTEKGEHNRMHDAILIAKNKVGYKNLLKITSKSNDIANILDTKYQRIPRLSVHDLAGLTDGLVCVLGERNSELKGEDDEQAQKYVLAKYKAVFSEVINQLESPIIWNDVRYLDYQFKEDFLILLCILLKCNLKDLPKEINKEMPQLAYLLYEDNSLKAKSTLYDESKPELVSRTVKFLDSIEEYDILSKPKVPKFDCPDGMSQAEYLRELCRSGWKRRFPTWENEEKKKVYADRVKHELTVISKSDFDGYFLITQDYINWAKRQGWLVGFGRGSSSGCLVSYLIGITEIDSILHDIIFERFLQEDRCSLPDIDTDFPQAKREQVIKYVEDKFGLDRVCHIATFGTLKGAGAVTEVLRAHNIFEKKKIESLTRKMPAEQKISTMMEEQKEDSIVRFTLKNFPEVLKELARINEDEITGEYSYHVKQAIRIENCIRGFGIHASGILISDCTTDELAPMMIESNGSSKICALEMENSEMVGLVKVDILGLKTLDVLMDIKALLGGYSEDQ